MKPTIEKIADNQKLRITLADKDKAELREILERDGSIFTWYQLLEWYICNGWEAPSPDTFALCSNPFLLTDDYSYAKDNDEVPDYGRVYFYEPHQVKCPIEQLLEHGHIILNSTEE